MRGNNWRWGQYLFYVYRPLKSYRSFTFAEVETAQIQQQFRFSCALTFCLSDERQSGACGVDADSCPVNFRAP